jgi:hypothetical protein
MNGGAGVALCSQCGEAFTLRDILAAAGINAVASTSPANSATPNLAHVPRGCWFRSGPDGWEAGATVRSCAALFFIPFTSAWTALTVGTTIATLISGKQALWLTLLDGAPFFVGSVFLIALSAMTILGSVKIKWLGGKLRIFTGVGNIGWTREVAVGPTTKIYLPPQWNAEGDMVPITLRGPDRIHFGSMLSRNRQVFLAEVIAGELGISVDYSGGRRIKR